MTDVPRVSSLLTSVPKLCVRPCVSPSIFPLNGNRLRGSSSLARLPDNGRSVQPNLEPCLPSLMTKAKPNIKCLICLAQPRIPLACCQYLSPLLHHASSREPRRRLLLMSDDKPLTDDQTHVFLLTCELRSKRRASGLPVCVNQLVLFILGTIRFAGPSCNYIMYIATISSIGETIMQFYKPAGGITSSNDLWIFTQSHIRSRVLAQSPHRLSNPCLCIPHAYNAKLELTSRVFPPLHNPKVSMTHVLGQPMSYPSHTQLSYGKYKPNPSMVLVQRKRAHALFVRFTVFPSTDMGSKPRALTLLVSINMYTCASPCRGNDIAIFTSFMAGPLPPFTSFIWETGNHFYKPAGGFAASPDMWFPTQTHMWPTSLRLRILS